MKKILTGTAIVLTLSFAACTRPTTDLQTPSVALPETQPTDTMKNFISIVEIPTTDFARAVSFYQTILDIKLEEANMEGIQMALFPNGGEGVFVHLIHGTGYTPSANGPVVYLNGGDDLQNVATRIEAHGGKVITPKTLIGPDMGYYAIFTDTEGNRLGLYSSN